MEEELKTIVQDEAVNQFKELECPDLNKMFGNLSLSDLLKLDIKLPSVDLDRISLDFELKLKYDEMFRDFTLKFPDISLPDLDFNGLFDFLAGKLSLPNLSDMSFKIKNPTDDILKGIEGIVNMTNEQIDKALANFANCDTFKKNILNPSLSISNELDKEGII